MIENRFYAVNPEKEDHINIRDRHTGLLFTFLIRDRRLGPAEYTRVTRLDTLELQSPPDEATKNEARTFAEDLAHERKLID